MRAHLYRVVSNAAGAVQPNFTVRVLQPDAVAPSLAPAVTDPVFVSKVGLTEIGTTFAVSNGVVDCWMDLPQYVLLGITVPGQLESFVDNVLVAAIASDTNAESVAIGAALALEA